MTTPPEHDHLASRLASLAEALGAQSAGGRGPFERPEWELLVRRRGQLDLVAVEDAPGMGPIDDWEIAHPKIGRLFSTAVMNDNHVAWDQYGVDSGPLPPGSDPSASVPGHPDVRRISGAVVIPYVRTVGGGCLVGMIKHERPLIGTTTLELPRGFAKPSELEISAAAREFAEEFIIEHHRPPNVFTPVRIAELNQDTAFFTGWIGVYACRFELEDSSGERTRRPYAPDVLEPIIPWTRQGTTGILVPLVQLSEPGAVACALSAAALWHFQAFLGAPLQPIPIHPRNSVDHRRFLASLEGQGRPSKAETALSPRERQVLGLLVGGLQNKEIAAALRCSARTIDRHVQNIFQKLGVENRTEAASLALRSSLLGRPE